MKREALSEISMARIGRLRIDASRREIAAWFERVRDEVERLRARRLIGKRLASFLLESCRIGLMEQR